MSRDVRIGALLFVLGLCLLGLGAHGYIENFDGDVEYLTARALWLRGDPGLVAHAPDSAVRETMVVEYRNPVSGRTGFDVMKGKQPERGERWYSWFGIAHAAFEAPLFGLGAALARAFPDLESAYRAAANAESAGLPEEEFFARLCVSFLSPVFGAATLVVLYLLARTLDLARGSAVAAALFGVFATQLWPQARESLSDTQGGFFFVLALLAIVCVWRGAAGRPALALAGVAAGLAVLTRVQHAIGLSVAVVWLWRGLWLRGRARDLVWLVGAGLPFAAFFLWFNWWRFGNVLESGYGVEAAGGFWNWRLFPLNLGQLLLAPGKGVLLFTPLLWAVIPALRGPRADTRRPILVLAALLFVAAWIPPAPTHGWHSGWTWGCRFLTPAVVFLVTVAVSLLGTRRRVVKSLAALGFVVSLGGVLTPIHGFMRLAFNAIRVDFPTAPPETRQDHVFFQPAYSPLHGAWIYFRCNADGTLASRDPHRITRAFGWPEVPSLSDPPQLAEDLAMRHLWYANLRHRVGFPAAWTIAGLTLVAALSGHLLRRASRPRHPSTAP